MVGKGGREEGGEGKWWLKRGGRRKGRKMVGKEGREEEGNENGG
jgi:hypothetical protein